MTTLRDEGIKAVASWTVNKSINVFEKKMIFFPINKAQHWTLCVVVNPGLVANRNTEGGLDQERAW
jgi:Ulp1 family protease